MKKIVSLAFTFFLMISMLVGIPLKVHAVGDWSSEWETAYQDALLLDSTLTKYDYAVGELESLFDTSSNVYLISNGSDLALVAFAVNNGYDFASEEIQLIGNIDLSDANWVPIGSINSTEDGSPFSGIFNGNGYTISNLTIDLTGYFYSAGLFGYTYNASVTDLNLSNVSISINGDYASVGALIGEAENTSVRNVHAMTGILDFSATAPQAEGVGGLIGYYFVSDDGDYSVSYVSSGLEINVVGVVYSIGGVIGYLETGTISISDFVGTVSALNAEAVGGLVGSNYGVVSNTYSVGNIEGLQDVGGLVGYNVGSIEYSYSAASVSPEETETVGVLLGSDESGQDVYESFYLNYSSLLPGGYYYDTEVGYLPFEDGFTDGYGITGLSSDELKLFDTFSSTEWDFGVDGIWIMVSGLNNGYPIFQYQNPEVTPDSFSITYVLDGGVNYAEAPASVTSDDTFELGAPSKVGYTFGGWFADAGLTNPITWIEIGTSENLTLYAKWNANQSVVVQPTITSNSEPLPNTGIDPSLVGMLPIGLALLVLKRKFK